MDDFAQTPRELKDVVPRLFAPGCEPSAETLPRYAAYHYQGKRPVQSGDSATVAVTLTDVKTGESAGEVQWSMKTINKVWKLTDAPLPAK
jgi:acyl dehydratase